MGPQDGVHWYLLIGLEKTSVESTQKGKIFDRGSEESRIVLSDRRKTVCRGTDDVHSTEHPVSTLGRQGSLGLVRTKYLLCTCEKRKKELPGYGS